MRHLARPGGALVLMNSTVAGVIVSDGKVRSGQGNTLVVFGFLISNISRFLAVFNRTAGLLFKKIIPTNSNDSLIYFKPSSNLNVLGW
jgi:hypothetical protein